LEMEHQIWRGQSNVSFRDRTKTMAHCSANPLILAIQAITDRRILASDGIRSAMQFSLLRVDKSVASFPNCNWPGTFEISGCGGRKQMYHDPILESVEPKDESVSPREKAGECILGLVLLVAGGIVTYWALAQTATKMLVAGLP
jgi:hypothetical protein